jgi:2-(1,2-epoxy-1,2-dihydrophenyl)acetyl-CoA isomerase
MKNRLAEIARDVAVNPEIKVVLLTGAGRGFCSGLDLSGDIAKDVDSGMRFRAHLMGANELLMKISEMEKPWIAVVNGPAVGAGCSLALACDLVLAAESAYLSMNFSGVGAVMDLGGTYILPRLVGLHKAMELAFFGTKVSAVEAEKMGLINKVISDDELMEGAREWGLRLAAGPSLTLGTLKLGMRRSMDSSLTDVLHWEVMMQSLVLQTQDAREGFKALLEKRKPKFEGK